MKIKNAIKKGTVLKVIVEADRIYLIGESGRLDITEHLEGDEIAAVKHLGQARAVVTSDEEISLVLYVQYHVHSEYSVLDGMSKLDDIAKKSSGITAITDHGNMYAMLKWQNAMKKVGKKAILGSEVYVENYLLPEGVEANSLIENENKNGCHLILLAKNDAGRKNLFTLSSNAYNNFYRKPHVSIEDLQKYSDGLVCTSACLGGELARLALEGNMDKVKEVARFYKGIFGEDYYIELQKHNIKDEQIVNPRLIQVANELGIKLVAANDSHYIDKEDASNHEILLCVNMKKSLSEPHFTFEGDGYHFKTDLEMVNEWHNMPEVIANTFEIADKCNVQIETGVYHLPKYPVPSGFNSEEDYFSYLVTEGFKARYEGTPKFTDNEYLSRLEYEKNVILSMGYAAYFLIVWDYVSWAKNNGIMVGPGRGSAAGSLVAYCLTITDLDPIEYDLLFERFLNPERVSMPDIDMDFADDRRQDVIDYVRGKYGADNVCGIITYGRMMAKQAVNDVGRVLEKSDVSKRISKLIPNEPKITLDKAINNSDELNQLINGDASAKEIIRISKTIEGNARQVSGHPCGVVVADQPVRNYMPTALVSDGDTKTLISQVTEVEDMGLLKMDFLGLKTMSVIGSTLDFINADRKANGLQEIPYYREIPLNDPYVYAEIAQGTSHAVFQIESPGMRSFMSELYSDVKGKIKEIEDAYGFTGFGEHIIGSGNDKAAYEKAISTFGDELFERMIAGVSLYRPGPMDYIPDYCRGINDPSSITYDTPLLEKTLKATYGVIVYQEQVMQIVRDLAGFSMPQSDSIRKGMGKKKQEILDEYMPLFIYGSKQNGVELIDEHTGNPYNILGCVNNGISEETALLIWNKMADFAKYAFNKSHAAVYAVLTVTCAWMKHYYPMYYMCSIINVYIDSAKLNGYINVTKELGIKILPPDVNKSYSLFTIEDGSIRFGFKGIKGLSKTVDVIANKREDGYKSVSDFVFRMLDTKIGTSGIASLVYSGAFDCFGHTRASIIENLDIITSQAKLKHKDACSGQMSLFDFVEYDVPEDFEIPYMAEFDKIKKLDKEKEYAGLYISEHPLDSFNETLKRFHVTDTSFLTNDNNDIITGKAVIAGCINELKVFNTKKGEKMAKFVLEDRSGSINCVVFPRDYEQIASNLYNNAIVIVKGTVNDDDSYGMQMVVSQVMGIEQASSSTVSVVYVKLDNENELEELEELIDIFKGNVRVVAQINSKLYELQGKAYPSSALYMTLQGRFGEDYVLYR